MADLDLSELAQTPEWLDRLRRLNSVRSGDTEGTVRFGAAVNMQSIAAAHVHEILTMIDRLEREVEAARGGAKALQADVEAMFEAQGHLLRDAHHLARAQYWLVDEEARVRDSVLPGLLALNRKILERLEAASHD